MELRITLYRGFWEITSKMQEVRFDHWVQKTFHLRALLIAVNIYKAGLRR